MAGNDEEIKVSLTADPSDLEAGMEASAAAVTEATSEMQSTVAAEAEAFNASVQSKIEAIARLNASFVGGISSATQVAEAEVALDAAMNAGAVTANEYAAYVSRLGAAETELAASSAAATTAVGANTAALAINGGVAREVGVMIGELARGNYARLEGSSFTLANRTGLLSSALSFLVSPAGLVTEALGAVAVAAYEGIADMNALREAIITTGGASGVSVDSLKGMEYALEKNGSTARQAREAITEVAASGLFLSNQMQSAANAASNFSEVTGVSMDSAVKAVSALSGNPAKALEDFNNRLHILTPAQAEQVAHLESMGQKAEATTLAVTLLSNGLQQYRSQLDASGDGDNKYFQKMQTMFSDTWESAKQLFSVSSSPLQKQLDEVTTQINQTAKAYKGLLTESSNGTINVNTTGASPAVVSQVNGLLKERQTLMGEISAQQQKQDQIAKQQAADDDAINKSLSGAKKSSDGAKQAQADKEAFDQMQLDRTLSLADEKAYWSQKLQAAEVGSASYRQALQQLVDIKNKEGEADKEAARKSIEAQHQTNAAVINDLNIQREQMQAGSSERIALDEKIVSTAAQLYGKDSAQYKTAVGEKMADDRAAYAEHKKALEEQRRDDEQDLADQKQIDDAELENKKQAYQQDFQDGNINAKQLLALEQGLAKDRLDVNVAYYAKKWALDADDVKAQEKDVAQIQLAVSSYYKEMGTDAAQESKNAAQQWKTAADSITRSFSSAFTGMLFQGQTLKQGMSSIAQSIAEQMIDVAIEKPFQLWVEKEAAKLAASLHTAAGVSAANTAQATTDAATAKTTTAQSIANAAGVAGANGLASFAAAPWPVDIGAPAFAAAMSAEALGYGSIASAAGGWGDIPADQLAMVHKNEMILPANIAQGVREMTSGGVGGGQQGGGDTHNWYIQTMDGRTTEQFFRNNMGVLAKAVKQKTTNNPQARR